MKGGDVSLLETWLLEIAKSLGKFVLNPLFPLSLLFAILVGYFRVKRERSDFHTRLLDGYNDLRVLLSYGLVLGLAFSIVTLAVGLTVPVISLVVIGAVTILFALTGRFQLLSAGITVGFSYLLLWAWDFSGLDIPYIPELENGNLLGFLPLLAGLLLMIEGILIRLSGWKGTSPKWIKSPRGMKVGALQSKKLWLVPMILFVPEGSLPPIFDWWPVISLGTTDLALVCVPFLLGFSLLVRSALPAIVVRPVGGNVFWFGAFITTVAAAGYWVTEASIAAGALAVLGRIWMAVSTSKKEAEKPYYFKRQPAGLMILGIIPGSPAETLSLRVGEIILKVNGNEISNEREFYEALQKNGAYCKLEVVGTNGENRLTQGALYEGDHHELGLLFTYQDERWETHQVS